MVHASVLLRAITRSVRRAHEVPSVVTDPGSSGFGRVPCYASAPTSSGGSHGTAGALSVHHIPLHLRLYVASCPVSSTCHTRHRTPQPASEEAGRKNMYTTCVRVDEVTTGMERETLHGDGDLRPRAA